MKQIRSFFVWCALLTKRLYKKASFLILLLLIPVLVCAYSFTAQEDSGILTIALAQEDPADPLAAEVVEKLQDSSQLILFIREDSPQKAERMVQTGKADAAWIFPADMEQKVYEFVTADKQPDSFVRVIIREETVPLMLTREKLSGALFPYCARAYYLDYMRQNAETLDHLTDEEILAYYDAAEIDDQLFAFSYMDSDEDPQKAETTSYLLTPLRGLLGVVIVLGGLATALYFIRDDAAGTFAWLPETKKPLIELGYLLISVVNISAVVFISLAVAGLSVHLGRELVVFLLYALCCASFCQLMRVWCGSLRLLGTVLPLLVVMMIAICPVFYDFATLRTVQFLLPPTYFVNGAYNTEYLGYMLIDIAACQFLSLLGRKCLRRI